MSKQTQGSLAMVGGIAGGVFLVAMVALMVVGDYAFSPALFLAAAVGSVVAVVLLIAFHRSPEGGAPERMIGRGAKAEGAPRHAPDSPTAAASGSTPPAAEPAHLRTASEPVTPHADVTVGTEPARLDQPREGGPDDLKRIRGIGPKLEESLNGMGIYHLDQIASWSGSEVAWMDEHLVEFRGRVSRDDWVGQARTLVHGGDASQQSADEVQH